MGGVIYPIEIRNGVVYDRAVLLKVRSPQNKDRTYVICAGLSEWGSLAAVSHLARRWKDLYRAFKKDEFCLVLEVQFGQYENADEIAKA